MAKWTTGFRTGVVVALLVAASCANDADPSREGATGASTSTTSVVRTTRPIPTTTLPDLRASFGLAASIRQFREDEVAGVIQVQLVRSPDVTDLLTVRTVQLVWPGLEPVAPTSRSVVVAPGQRVDVPTPLGSAAGCAAGDVPSFDRGHVEATVDGPGGAPVTVVAPLLADAQAALDNVWGKRCRAQRVERSVGLAFDPNWTRSDRDGVPAATGTLVVTRRTALGVNVVRSIDGSVLLVAELGPGTWTMAEGVAELRVPVTVRASGRCDGHALGDSKKTYDFQVQLIVEGDLGMDAEVTVPPADRGVPASVIADTCAAVAAR